MNRIQQQQSVKKQSCNQLRFERRGDKFGVVFKIKVGGMTLVKFGKNGELMFHLAHVVQVFRHGIHAALIFFFCGTGERIAILALLGMSQLIGIINEGRTHGEP